MYINRFNLRNVIAIAVCLAVTTMFSGCKKEDDPTDEAITIANEQSLTQEVYADNISGNSLTSFTTTGAWSSSITETTSSSRSAMLKSGNSPDWISIDPASGDKAGTYNVSIILEPNVTGVDRTAVITITCEGKEIKITITQKSVKENGNPLTIKDFLLLHTWKHLITITKYEYPENYPLGARKDEEDKTGYILTFQSDDVVTFSFGGSVLVSIQYTISGNSLTLYMPMDDGITIQPRNYTVSKYSDSELILVGKNLGGTWGTGGLSGTYDIMETRKYIK